VHKSSGNPKDDEAPDVGGSLAAQFEYVDGVLQDKLDHVQSLFWTLVWQRAVRTAAAKLHSNRVRLYFFQATATAAAVTIPALVGLNLNGSGGTAVRVASFVVGLIGALATAALQLFRYGPRWRLYRDYYHDLITLGRQFAAGVATAGSCPPEEWEKFRVEVISVIEKYDAAYDSDIITPTQPR
jgi:hypothetical protein